MKKRDQVIKAQYSEPTNSASDFGPFKHEDLTNIKTLDDLLAFAERYAEHYMRASGSLPMTLFLITSDGLGVLKADALANEAAIDTFIDAAQLLCVVRAATACVLAAEASVSLRDGLTAFRKLGENVPASHDPDRRELVVLAGESQKDGRKQKLLPIVRSEKGEFSGFGRSVVNTDPREGPPIHLLPTEVPDEKAQREAFAQMKMNIVGIQNLSSNDLNEPPDSKVRDIIEATGNANLARIKALLKDKPDLVNVKDEYGITPLHLANQRRV